MAGKSNSFISSSKDMSLKKWLFIVLAAWLGYFALYQAISKPLTDGEISRLIDKKINLLKEGAGNRIIILAGSNGRFSHRCETISDRIHLPCINASLMAGIGIDYILALYEPLLRKGDVIYMPLEYEQYLQSKNDIQAGPENAILWRTNPSLLRSLGWERTVRASLYADEKYFINGLVETVLSQKGIKRRFDEASINSQGDQTGHTQAAGAPYIEFLKAKAVTIPIVRPASDPRHSSILLSRFLKDAKEKGIVVIGGLPSTFSDVEIPAVTHTELKEFFQKNGHDFLTLPTLSQYPRSCFFDMPYHLNESCQKIHSEALADELGSIINRMPITMKHIS